MDMAMATRATLLDWRAFSPVPRSCTSTITSERSFARVAGKRWSTITSERSFTRVIWRRWAVPALRYCPRKCIRRLSALDEKERQNTTEETQIEHQTPRDAPRDASTQETSRRSDSTDWIASSLTRRFGLGAGLAWVAAFGVISEQIKTRTELFLENEGTRDVEATQEIVLPNKIAYVDLRTGGGSSPQKGDLVVVDVTGKLRSNGRVFVDTTTGDKRSVAFVIGGRPYAGGLCEGLEYALRSMKAGGIRKVTIPSELGFGETDMHLAGMEVPGGSELEYVVHLLRVSVAPS